VGGDGEMMAMDAVGVGGVEVEMEVLPKELGKGGFEGRGVGAKREEGAENHVAAGAANEVETEEFHGVSCGL